MKKILLFILLLFISGCTSEYNLYISDDEIKENIHIEYFQNENSPEIADEYYVFHDSEDAKYVKNITKKENLNILDLDYTYKPEEYTYANSINSCFNKKNIMTNNKDYFKIELSEYTGCVEDNNFDIKIKTTNKVLENNADIVKGNTYIWHVNKNNSKDFSLNIKIAKGNLKNNMLYLFVIAFIIIVVAFLVILKYKKNQHNEVNVNERL